MGLDWVRIMVDGPFARVLPIAFHGEVEQYLFVMPVEIRSNPFGITFMGKNREGEVCMNGAELVCDILVKTHIINDNGYFCHLFRGF